MYISSSDIHAMEGLSEDLQCESCESRGNETCPSSKFPSGGLPLISRDVFTKKAPSKSWHCKKKGGGGVGPMPRFFVGFDIVYEGHRGKLTHKNTHTY